MKMMYHFTTLRCVKGLVAACIAMLMMPSVQAQYWDQDGYYHEAEARPDYGNVYDDDENFYERDSNWDRQHQRYRHDQSCNRGTCSRRCHYQGWNHRDHDRRCNRNRCYRSCKHYRRSSVSYSSRPSTRGERVAVGVIVGAAILSAVLDNDNHNGRGYKRHHQSCTRQRCHSSCRFHRH